MKKRMFSEKSISEGLRLAGLDYEAMSKKGQGAMRETQPKNLVIRQNMSHLS